MSRESDEVWHARREADFAQQDLARAQSDLSRAQDALNVQRGYEAISLGRGDGPKDYGPPVPGGGIGHLIFWPIYFFWREIIFLIVLLFPAFWFSQQGAVQYFYHFKSVGVAYSYIFGGLAIGLVLGLLIALKFKFRLFRIMVMLVVATPLLFEMEMAAFTVRATKVVAFTKTLSKEAQAKYFLGNNYVNSTFSPEALLLLNPQERLQDAWKKEVALPELKTGDHNNPNYQQLWLSSYIAENVPPADLRNPKLAQSANSIKITQRIESDPWPTWPSKYKHAITTAGMVAFGQKYAMVFLYFLPAIGAFWNPKEGRWMILLINVFLGWTIIGWFWAGFKTLGASHDKKARLL
jgi:hypothetical protein